MYHITNPATFGAPKRNSLNTESLQLLIDLAADNITPGKYLGISGPPCDLPSHRIQHGDSGTLIAINNDNPDEIAVLPHGNREASTLAHLLNNLDELFRLATIGAKIEEIVKEVRDGK